MVIAARTSIEKFTNADIYGAAAAVNAAVVAASGGRLPCYAINGKRVAFKWVSVGSSAVIGRGEATRMLSAVGVSIEEVEAV